MICEFHWTWETIDEMTIPQLNAIDSYWQRHPPIHILIPAYMGFKPEESTKEGEVKGDLDSLAGLFGSAPGLSIES